MTNQHYITTEFPPLGGRIKERVEDFLVDEQPLYQPGGSGEHIYLFIQKRNMSTPQAARVLADHFGVPMRAVGFAGMKDKVAMTRQVFSIHVPGKKLEDFPMLQHEQLGLMWADYHANKLRRGHLAGNRFSIKIRGVPATGALLAHKVLRRLEKVGLPNRFGEQRFGNTGRNHLVGRSLIAGDPQGVLDAILAPLEGEADTRDSQREGRAAYRQGEFAEALEHFSRESRTERQLLGALARGATPARAVKMIGVEEELLYLSAFQSFLFNEVLDQRVSDRTFDVLLAGDLAIKHVNRAVFDVAAEMLEGAAGEELRHRLSSFEISPSGPMWGARMKRASGEIGERELAALRASEITPEILEAYDRRRPNRVSGERRALRAQLTDPDVEGGVDEHGGYVRVAFDLPRGAYATAVLREIMKIDVSMARNPTAAAAEPEDREAD